MSNTPKTSDRDAFEILIRSGQRKNKVNWIMRGDRQDVDDLNAAIRKASGPASPRFRFPLCRVGRSSTPGQCASEHLTISGSQPRTSMRTM